MWKIQIGEKGAIFLISFYKGYTFSLVYNIWILVIGLQTRGNRRFSKFGSFREATK